MNLQPAVRKERGKSLKTLIQRSNRKTISLTITKSLDLLLKVPYGLHEGAIENFLGRHSGWIAKHLALQQAQNEKPQPPPLPEERVRELREATRRIVWERVAYFSRIMGVLPTGIKITSARARWGSCSAENCLCFPYRIALLPPELIDYIVVHELAHIRVKNHGAAFYEEVARWLPDYRQRIAALKQAQRELVLA